MPSTSLSEVLHATLRVSSLHQRRAHGAATTVPEGIQLVQQASRVRTGSTSLTHGVGNHGAPPRCREHRIPHVERLGCLVLVPDGVFLEIVVPDACVLAVL